MTEGALGSAPRTSTASYAAIGNRFRWSLVNSVSGLAASMITLLAVSRVVEPGEYGRVAVILAAWGLLFNSVDWCGGLLMRFGPVELRERGTLGVAIGTRLVFAAPVLLPLVTVGPLALFFGFGWSPALSSLTALWFLVATAHNVLQWSAIAAQRFVPLAIAGVVVKITPLAAVGWAAFAGIPVRAELLVCATVAGHGLGALILAGALGRLVAIGRPDGKLLGAMWRYSLPGLLGLPAMAAINWLDPLLLDRWSTRADVGRYQLAYPIFTLFAMLGASLNSVLSPELVRRIAQRDFAAVERYRDRDQPLLALLLGVAAFGGACLAAPLARAVLPDRYAVTAELIALLSVAGGFLLAFWTMHPLVTATDSVWSLQLAIGCQAIANVVGDVALAHRYGSTGVAVANVFAWAAAFVTLTLQLGRRIEARPGALVPLLAAGVAVTLLLVENAPVAARIAVGAALFGTSGALGFRELQRRKQELQRQKKERQ